MFEKVEKASDLNHEETATYIVDLFNKIIIHHALWFSEVKHQMGMEKALELLQNATKKSYGIQMKHLGSLLGFDMVDGVPAPLLEMAPEKLKELKSRVAKNWLVNDGVWFQAIEFSEGMNDAKRCNDSCWAQFSPFEASSIKKLLGLGTNPGLDGLKRALGFRVYEAINEQSVVEETESSFIFQMNQCRVQNARKRKGLDDYPCKSGGLVEYSYFARAIDSRIKTECLGCPPDEHPPEWFCAWKFSLE
ncbi:MAG: cytosolic protein [Desulfobulbaceae bacterium S3730MH12]|nr:MAG: cytosolic protein [Desulfobulbaceae bacterium S5133MH15]OEU54392.1 MAG: cytosolic protein [Desulfobulbaceae bacterium S3730MH12]OEU79138.1 MAG: cytosolic protein [Desulfobulbaceae bacterium C00003063]